MIPLITSKELIQSQLDLVNLIPKCEYKTSIVIILDYLQSTGYLNSAQNSAEVLSKLKEVVHVKSWIGIIEIIQLCDSNSEWFELSTESCLSVLPVFKYSANRLDDLIQSLNEKL